MPSNRLAVMGAAGAGEESGVWTQVGSTQTLNTVTCAGISSSRVALIYAPYHLRMYDFNGTTWSQTGSSLGITGSSNHRLASLTATRVAMYDTESDYLRTFDWNGTVFAQVGTSLSLVDNISAICRLTSSTIAFIGYTTGLRTYSFNGTSWSQVGNILATGNVGNNFCCALTSTRIVVGGTNSDTLKVFDFDGTDWSLTATSDSLSPLQYGDLCRLSDNTFALCYAEGFSSTSHLTKYAFSGTSFTALDDDFNFGNSYSNTICEVEAPATDASRVFTYAGTATGRTFDWVT